MFDRYSAIREKLKARLQAKTSWGRNELLVVVDEVLVGVADDEIASLMEQYIATGEPAPWED